MQQGSFVPEKKTLKASAQPAACSSSCIIDAGLSVPEDIDGGPPAPEDVGVVPPAPEDASEAPEPPSVLQSWRRIPQFHAVLASRAGPKGCLPVLATQSPVLVLATQSSYSSARLNVAAQSPTLPVASQSPDWLCLSQSLFTPIRRGNRCQCSPSTVNSCLQLAAVYQSFVGTDDYNTCFHQTGNLALVRNVDVMLCKLALQVD
ncbi:hypothetical protein AOLI_G00315550 [Acnodon oligacanthus]